MYHPVFPGFYPAASFLTCIQSMLPSPADIHRQFPDAVSPSLSGRQYTDLSAHSYPDSAGPAVFPESDEASDPEARQMYLS